MPLWTPAEIPTALWLDADDATTLTEAGGTVSAWNDKSGNAHNVAQVTETLQPALIAAGLNGRSVLRFDGIDDRLTRGTSANLLRDVSGAAAFVVRKYATTAPAVQIQLYISQPTPNAARFVVEAGRTADRINGGGRRLSSDSYQTVEEPTAMDDAWHTQQVILDYANSDAHLYLDGALIASNLTFQTAGNTDATDPGAVNVGTNGTGDQWFAGDIAEIIVLNETPTPFRRQLIEGYLAWQWGLQDNLPTGHAYELAAPQTTAVVITNVTDGTDRIFEVAQTGIQIIGTGFGADPDTPAPQTVINLSSTAQSYSTGTGLSEEVRSGFVFTTTGGLNRFTKVGDLAAALFPIADQWATELVDGSLYELMVTQISGNVVVGLTLDTWLPLGTQRSVYLSGLNHIQQTQNATVNFSVREIASQLGVLDVSYTIQLIIGDGGNPDT